MSMTDNQEPAPNWCPKCGTRPDNPYGLFCGHPFHSGLATPQSPKPAGAVPQADGDMVLIERGLIGAACHAIEKKRDAPNLLVKLRAVTMLAGRADAVPAWFGELPAPISNPEAWPANYADGYNDALNMCYDVIRGHAPQPMTTQGEAEDAARWRYVLRQLELTRNAAVPSCISMEHLRIDEIDHGAFPGDDKAFISAAIDAARLTGSQP